MASGSGGGSKSGRKGNSKAKARRVKTMGKLKTRSTRFRDANALPF